MMNTQTEGDELLNKREKDAEQARSRKKASIYKFLCSLTK